MDDRELEARLKTAFDPVEPSPEAADRMLAALMAAQAERDVEAFEAATAEDADVAAEHAEPNPVLASAARKAKPGIRPVWKVAVPIAACLLAVAIIAGPLQGMIGGAGGMSSGASKSESADSYAGEAAADMAAEPAATNSAVPTADDGAVVEGLAYSDADESVAAEPAEGSAGGESTAKAIKPDSAGQPASLSNVQDEEAPAEGITSTPTVGAAPFDASSVESIALGSGKKLALVLDGSAPIALEAADAGALVEHASAKLADGSRLSCDVYEYDGGGVDAPSYAVRFEGAEELYLARAL